jgi:hypothetical protein
MIQAFHNVSPGIEIQAWVNVLPFGAPANVVEDDYDYSAYCAKPFVLAHARNTGADIAILLDAAFYPIRSVQPLVEHIARHGYYLCDNGMNIGEWSSDRCLERMSESRRDVWGLREASSYCVGLNFGDGRCIDLLQRWCGFASDRLTIPGPHDNDQMAAPPLVWRNLGMVSSDERVRGHRHDQTVLSILAHRLGMTRFTQRPMFTSYKNQDTADTVLINEGLG